MIIFVQKQLRPCKEFVPVDREEDAVGARGRDHAPMKLGVSRALNHDYTEHRFLEHTLQRLGHC
jgi:hypothetical protein